MKLSKLEVDININIIAERIKKMIIKSCKDSVFLSEVKKMSVSIDKYGDEFITQEIKYQKAKVGNITIDVKVLGDFPFKTLEFLILQLSFQLEKLLTLLCIKYFKDSYIANKITYQEKVFNLRKKLNTIAKTEHWDFVNSIRTLSNLIKHGPLYIPDENITKSWWNFSHFIMTNQKFDISTLLKRSS